MKNYLEVKEKLEKQGWYVYQSMGGKSYFGKKDVVGIGVVVDQATGETQIYTAAPKYYIEKHKPVL
jgi:hypothetical protein